MSETITLNGIVLKTMPVGEYDVRLVILTKERGKITAFARGAKRAKSALQAAASCFCHATFYAYEGKDAYTVTRAQIHESFRALTADYEKTCYGFYFLEVAERFSEENLEVTDLLNLLYLTLNALVKNILPASRIRRIYELRTLVFHGTYPHVTSCVKCGKKEPLVRYDRFYQGMICDECSYSRGSSQISPDVLYTLRYIMQTPLPSLYAFSVSDEVFEQTERIIRGFFKYYQTKPFVSLRFLQSDE